MKFNISGFTHKGTGAYEKNEDHILVNSNLLNEGEICLLDQEYAVCFVSDGVGGNAGGDYASEFILYRVDLHAADDCQNLNRALYTDNEELISYAKDDSIRGCACTLSGAIIKNNFEDFYHVGDSEIWLLRDKMLLKVSEDEVLDEDNPKSPLVNYFGGNDNILKINQDWVKPEVLEGDTYVFCSDGLFKSLKVKEVKSILLEPITMDLKAAKLKAKCLEQGSDDNVSAIILQVINNE